MPGIPDKVTGKTQWSCDVTLPGMLHARMVRPATLGSTLDFGRHDGQETIPDRGSRDERQLVAVVSPNEWEAISAARSVADGDEVDRLVRAARQRKRNENSARAKMEYALGECGNIPKLAMALTTKAAKTISATYEQPLCSARADRSVSRGRGCPQ